MIKKVIALAKKSWALLKTPGVSTPRNDAARTKLKSRHEECSRNLRNSILTFAGFAAVCWTTLSKPDIELLVDQSQVTIPFAQITVTLDKFLTVVPYVVLILVAHSAVFRLRLNVLDPHVPFEDRLSTLFNLPGAMAKIATFFLHVAVPTALVLFLLAKSRSYSGSGVDDFILMTSLIFIFWPNLFWHIINGNNIKQYEDKNILIMSLIQFSIFYPIIIIGYNFPPDFSGIDFTQKPALVKKVISIKSANFSGTSFKNLTLRNLELGNVNFTNANLSNVDLTKTRFRNATFTNANLTGADLEAAVFVNSSLSNINLEKANLMNADLSSLFRVFNFDMAITEIDQANLMQSILTGANLTGVDLTEANLTEAILKGANLTGAKLNKANLKNADLSSAILTDCDLSNATNMTQVQLANVQFDPKYPPTLPEGLILP